MTDNSLYLYIEDTGYMSVSDLTGTRLPLLSSATSDQKNLGEFRANNRIRLKIDSINIGDSNNTQVVPSVGSVQTKTKTISKSPLTISIGGYIDKPSIFTLGQEVKGAKDLPDLDELAMMLLTKGHKDLYFDSDAVGTLSKRGLFSLYRYMDLFGRANASNSNSRQHLNVSLDSYSINEGNSRLSYNLSLTVLELDF